MAEQDGLDQLKRDLKRNTPARLYVFCGEEAYLRNYYLEQLRKQLIEDFAEAFNYHRFNSDTLTQQRFGDSVNAAPMMAQHSLVRVDDVNFFAMGEDAAAYAKLLSDIPDYCTVVLVYETVEFKIDKRKKTLAEAFSQATVVEFRQPEERELVGWVGRHLKKYQKQITSADALYLIRRTGGAMTTLLSEIDKLGAYVEHSVVTQKDIDLLVEPVLEAMTFDLSDAICAGHYDTAMEKLQILLRKMKEEEYTLILGAISTQIRRALTAKRLISAGKNQQDLMKLCGIQSYPAQKTMEYARRLPDKYWENSMELCLNADIQLKTSYDEPQRIFELLVIRLAMEARHA